MKRFIVIGTFYDKSAHLHVVAANKEAALAEYHTLYGDDIKNWDISVCSLDDGDEHMQKHWKEHGHHTAKGNYSILDSMYAGL